MFPSKEDALEFLDNHNLDEARIKLLVDLGRILEAAKIHAKNGDMLKAVEILNVSATHGVSFVRPTIEYLLTGLRRGLTLGVLSTSSPTISKLLVRAGRLNKNAMTEQELDEVSPPHPFNLRFSHPGPPACDV